MRVLLAAGGLVALATAPAQAATHHKGHTSSTHHGHSKSTKSHGASHHAQSSHASKSTHGKSARAGKAPESKKAQAAGAPGGAITVGSGGTKLFCAGRASPLLVRKATQGNGTTVTVICR